MTSARHRHPLGEPIPCLWNGCTLLLWHVGSHRPHLEPSQCHDDGHGRDNERIGTEERQAPPIAAGVAIAQRI